MCNTLDFVMLMCKSLEFHFFISIHKKILFGKNPLHYRIRMKLTQKEISSVYLLQHICPFGSSMLCSAQTLYSKSAVLAQKNNLSERLILQNDVTWKAGNGKHNATIWWCWGISAALLSPCPLLVSPLYTCWSKVFGHFFTICSFK